MPKIVSISESVPQNEIEQKQVAVFARELFVNVYKDIERLLKVFENGQIEKRHFAKPLSWYQAHHTLEEKNSAYIETAVPLGMNAIEDCLSSSQFLKERIPYEEIEAIFFISSTGMATPSIEARIMNKLPFSCHTKRIPIWGLGCAGGAAGLSRAFEYCQAYPNAKVLVLSVELCSLTFQPNDLSKSNLIGTSLFADGAACALVCGDESNIEENMRNNVSPKIMASQSTLMPESMDVMGWEIKNDGLFVVFSRNIPSIIEGWLKPNVTEFLRSNRLKLEEIHNFIAHPGGKKVLEAYVSSLSLPYSMIEISQEVLTRFGNMSSATILFVLKKFMEKKNLAGTYGLCTALGPGFSSELLLLRWE